MEYQRPKIIIDSGSCHCGRLDWAKEFIDIAADLDVEVKYQLFPNTSGYTASGNRPLPYDWLLECFEYGKSKGVNVFASVFELDALEEYRRTFHQVKLAYSRSNMAGFASAITGFSLLYASYGVMNRPTTLPDNVVPLYCIPQYPVPFQVAFDDLFYGRFVGFSDHTLGIHQTLNALDAGAQIIEKHVRLDRQECDHVPDGKFAITPKQLKELVTWIG